MVARAPIPEPDTVDLEVKNLHRVLGGQVIHSHLSFGVRSGQILFVSGPSGCGKTVLLRCLSCLDPIDGGSITLNGNTPEQWGIPHWRALVHYVHQARIAHPGTPTEFYELVQGFATQKGRPRGDLASIVTSFGLEPQILKEPWQDLSGGQAQRVSIAIALALSPKVLLLDEPTSALDPDSAHKVERALRDSGLAIIWVSHDPGQPGRVGGRLLELPQGDIEGIPRGPAKPQDAEDRV